MTKFQRAKQKMLELYHTLIVQLIDDEPAGYWGECAFYLTYSCEKCPVFLAEEQSCIKTLWWEKLLQAKRISADGRKRNRLHLFGDATFSDATKKDKEDALVFLLARYGYIESLEE